MKIVDTAKKMVKDLVEEVVEKVVEEVVEEVVDGSNPNDKPLSPEEY